MRDKLIDISAPVKDAPVNPYVRAATTVCPLPVQFPNRASPVRSSFLGGEKLGKAIYDRRRMRPERLTVSQWIPTFLGHGDATR